MSKPRLELRPDNKIYVVYKGDVINEKVSVILERDKPTQLIIHFENKDEVFEDVLFIQI